MPEQGSGVAYGSGRGPTPMSDSFQTTLRRDLVIVEGPDATSFLQSLVSQDLDPIAIGASAHALLLQPQLHSVSSEGHDRTVPGSHRP